MEQFSDENMYVIDLGDVNSAPEIIFQLSSVLDKDEVKNKRICLRLGNIDLNQAQLLSIKSLINGIDSNLSCIDTKSVETEKVALSLGIIVSNISSENTMEVTPAMPYKLADELKEELSNNTSDSESMQDEACEIVEEADNAVSEVIEEEIKEEISEQVQISDSEIQETTEQDVIVESSSIEEKDQTAAENDNLNVISNEQPAIPAKEDVRDELDVIFGSNPAQTRIFDLEVPEEVYEEREELTDIIVPEQEYTKEDIELEGFPTKYIKQTIRSGQVINYEGNIVIIGDCHPGCEITAFGDITVWGILSGIAHAGAGGNQKAKVRALKMNAIQLRIANCYSRRPDSLNTVYIEKTNSYTPEEARIVNNEIVVFKIND